MLHSGSNADGENGLITTGNYGGEVAVQDRLTAQINYMQILKIEEMGTYINSLVKRSKND